MNSRKTLIFLAAFPTMITSAAIAAAPTPQPLPDVEVRCDATLNGQTSQFSTAYFSHCSTGGGYDPTLPSACTYGPYGGTGATRENAISYAQHTDGSQNLPVFEPEYNFVRSIPSLSTFSIAVYPTSSAQAQMGLFVIPTSDVRAIYGQRVTISLRQLEESPTQSVTVTRELFESTLDGAQVKAVPMSVHCAFQASQPK